MVKQLNEWVSSNDSSKLWHFQGFQVSLLAKISLFFCWNIGVLFNSMQVKGFNNSIYRAETKLEKLELFFS